MDVLELFKGVAVVIDDEVNDVNAKELQNILNQIKSKSIPLLTYDSIPNDETSHFQNLSFVILDWDLKTKEISSEEITMGVRVAANLKKSKEKENIEFIKEIKKICFCPIFIFTNAVIDNVIEKLESSGLYIRERPNHIFIKSKKDLVGRVRLFREIENWIKNTPSIYVLKEWEREYQSSKNKLFTDFQEMSPIWPKIMWKNFDDDGVNKSYELGELISRNLHTRMTPFEFDNGVLSKRGKKLEESELRRVLEGERFLKNENLHENDISPGDIFYIGKKYFLNIRAACDLIPNRSKPNSSYDDVELYLLKGTKVPNGKAQRIFNKEYGHFQEIDCHSIIFPIHDGKVVDFRYKNFEIKKWKEIKSNRIGRVLPPYITRIQQRYALFLQRQGLPRIPAEAI